MRADIVDLSGTGIGAIAIKARVTSITERRGQSIRATVAYLDNRKPTGSRAQSLLIGQGPWTRMLKVGDMILAKGRITADPVEGFSFVVDENSVVRLVHEPQQ